MEVVVIILVIFGDLVRGNPTSLMCSFLVIVIYEAIKLTQVHASNDTVTFPCHIEYFLGSSL